MIFTLRPFRHFQHSCFISLINLQIYFYVTIATSVVFFRFDLYAFFLFPYLFSSQFLFIFSLSSLLLSLFLFSMSFVCQRRRSFFYEQQFCSILTFFLPSCYLQKWCCQRKQIIKTIKTMDFSMSYGPHRVVDSAYHFHERYLSHYYLNYFDSIPCFSSVYYSFLAEEQMIVPVA